MRDFWTREWDLPMLTEEPPFTLDEIREAYWPGWSGTFFPLLAVMLPRETQELMLLAADPRLPTGDIVEIGTAWAATSFAMAKCNGFTSCAHRERPHSSSPTVAG